MKAKLISRSALFAMSAAILFACKKTDDGELDKEGQSTENETEVNTANAAPADTISGGKEGINGSSIGSGEPNTSGTGESTP